MKLRRQLRVLQLSHDYTGPFVDVCRQYNAPFEREDCHVTTLYVRGPFDADVARRTGGDEVLFLEQRKGSMRGIKFDTIFRIAALFREQHFDVVIAHRYKCIYFAGVMSHFFRIPVILGVAHEHRVFARPTRSLFLTFWCRQVKVVGVSATIAADVLAEVPGLTGSGRVMMLHHAIDLERRAGLLDRAAARAELGLPATGIVVGTVGRLMHKKNQALMVQSVSHFSSDVNHVVLVGDGPERVRLEAMAASSPAGGRIVFTGRRPEAWRLMAAFDVFVCTSTDAEAFGIVLLEAMLAGVPVVACDAPGPAEVLGETGRVVPPETGALAAAVNEVLALPVDEREALVHRQTERLETAFSYAAFERALWALPPLSAVHPDR